MSVCRSCGAPIRWVTTTKGKTMPVDLPPTPSQTPIVPMLGVMHTSHFATCPNADEWRKR